MKPLYRRLLDRQDHQALCLVALLQWLAEGLLCALIIWKVPYTEIDWKAYMEQVDGYLQGELDYRNLEGGTGPLVYPAGHVHLYTALHSITQQKIFPAQVVFAFLYMANLMLVLIIYIRSKALPPLLLPLLSLSKRLHSIYLLRLFNDCWAILFAHAATLLLLLRKVPWAIVLFSVAVSIKMNILLMAPGALMVVLLIGRVQDLVVGGAAGLAVQLGLAAPFLMAAPDSYIERAFEISRVFKYEWTVNLKFLPEEAFLSKRLAAALLAANLLLLTLFFFCKWKPYRYPTLQLLSNFWHRTSSARQPKQIQMHSIKRPLVEPPSISKTSSHPSSKTSSHPSSKTSSHPSPAAASTAMPLGAEELCSQWSQAQLDYWVAWVVFTSNFIGVVCARSLHYQFYSWYAQSIPLLLSGLPFWGSGKLLLWLAIEVVWNVFPPTWLTSAVLLTCHLAMLGGLLLQRHPGARLHVE